MMSNFDMLSSWMYINIALPHNTPIFMLRICQICIIILILHLIVNIIHICIVLCRSSRSPIWVFYLSSHLVTRELQRHSRHPGAQWKRCKLFRDKSHKTLQLVWKGKTAPLFYRFQYKTFSHTSERSCFNRITNLTLTVNLRFALWKITCLF